MTRVELQLNRLLLGTVLGRAPVAWGVGSMWRAPVAWGVGSMWRAPVAWGVGSMWRAPVAWGVGSMWRAPVAWGVGSMWRVPVAWGVGSLGTAPVAWGVGSMWRAPVAWGVGSMWRAPVAWGGLLWRGELVTCGEEGIVTMGEEQERGVKKVKRWEEMRGEESRERGEGDERGGEMSRNNNCYITSDLSGPFFFFTTI